MSYLHRLGEEFRIDIPTDEKRYVGRECPNPGCLGYFKITSGTGIISPQQQPGPSEGSSQRQISSGLFRAVSHPLYSTRPLYTTRPLSKNVSPLETHYQRETDTGDSQSICYCPYCGHTAPPSDFATPEQLEYAKSVAMRQISEALFKDFSASGFPSR